MKKDRKENKRGSRRKRGAFLAAMLLVLAAAAALYFAIYYRAAAVMAEHDYARWYLGGHSLGGAVAANYAAAEPEGLEGLVLLSAYPTKPLAPELRELSLYGTEDGVLSLARLEQGRQFAPPESEELVIEGGNHAQFGSYGAQRGDGAATIAPEEQWTQAASFIAAEIDRAA